MGPTASERRANAVWTVQILLAAALSGGLLALSFPPASAPAAAWFALVPLLVALSTVSRPRQGALLGGVTGVVFFGLLLLFIGQYGALPWAALATFQALFLAGFGLIAVPALKFDTPLGRAIGLAAAWTAAEWVRGHAGALAFTFGGLAYSQSGWPAVIQPAAWVGPYGLAALIAFANAALAVALRGLRDSAPLLRSPVLPLALAGALAIPLWAWGCWRMQRTHEPAAAPLDVLLVQADEPTATATGRRARALGSLRTHLDLTREAVRPETDLIVWSETAVDIVLSRESGIADIIADAARRAHVHLVTGAPDQDAEGRSYNGMYLFTPNGGLADRYQKVRLVVFGEYVPWRDRLAFVQRYPIRLRDYAPGAGHTTFDLGDTRLGPMICFESIFPEVSRTVVRRGANVLLFITSDAWAGRSPELRQHLQCSVLRAVETGRPVVRAAATGVTCLIDANGRIVNEAPPHVATTIHGAVLPRWSTTPYVLWGDGPVLVLLGATFGAALRARRRRRSAPLAGPTTGDEAG